MNKCFKLVLALLLVVSLSACSKPSDNGESAYDKLVNGLSGNYQYIESEIPGSWFIKVGKDGSMTVAVYCAGGGEFGQISEVIELEEDKYQLKLDVPAFEGDMMTDAHDAYSLYFVIDYNNSETITVEFPEAYQVGVIKLYADNGLDASELFSRLSSFGDYQSTEMCLNFSEGYYTKWIENSGYHQSGQIRDLQYKGFGVYQFTVDYPEVEETMENTKAEAYSATVEMTIMDDYSTISICEEANGEIEVYFVQAN
ncbi:MAG: hypothetical protein ACI4WG_02735 [Erysipelotrichaceae bacterium]